MSASLDKAMDSVNQFMDSYPSLCQSKRFQSLEASTGYKAAHMFLAAFATLFTVLFFIGGSKLVSDLFGFVYPAYMSFKAVDSADPNDDTQWLTYWVVFACLSILESGLSFIVSAIPFYFFLKCGLFIWLYHPTTMGASVIYCSLIRPNLRKFMEDGVEKKNE